MLRAGNRTITNQRKRPRTRGRFLVVAAAMILATYDLWAFVSTNWEELLDGLLNTLKVSAMAIVGAFVIGLVLGAARAHRIPVVSQSRPSTSR